MLAEARNLSESTPLHTSRRRNYHQDQLEVHTSIETQGFFSTCRKEHSLIVYALYCRLYGALLANIDFSVRTYTVHEGAPIDHDFNVDSVGQGRAMVLSKLLVLTTLPRAH